MPIKVMEVADGLGVALVCSGDITGHDFVAATRELLAWEQSKLGNLVAGIVDHTGAFSFQVQQAELEVIVTLDLRLMPLVHPGFLVAVAAPEDIQFGVSRMWQASAARTGWEIHVDRDREDAQSWLRDRSRLKFGIDVPAFDYSA